MKRAPLALAGAFAALTAAACDEEFRFDQPEDRPTCDPPCGLSLVCGSLNQCYECLVDADCTIGDNGYPRRCTDGHQCVSTCEDDPDCPGEHAECHGICEPCDGDDCECQRDDECAPGRCDPRSKTCVACVYSSECPLDRRWCDPDRLTCVP